MQNPKSPGASLIQLLLGLHEYIKNINPELYASKASRYYSGSIGEHVRHSLDHIEILLDAIQNNKTACYNHRIRGTQIETDPLLASDTIIQLTKIIDSLTSADLNKVIQIKDTIKDRGDSFVFESTVTREVFFTAHHLIHHNAMISAILKENSIPIEDSFGMAPSTIQYKEQC